MYKDWLVSSLSDNIEHLYSNNTANLHIYFLLVWVIECLITGLKLKMAYLWLQSLMQSIDFKSYSATTCLMIMSVCTNTCYYIFFCITKTLQNVKFIHVYKSPVIKAGQHSGRRLSFFCNVPLSPQFFPIQIWCHRVSLYLQSNPVVQTLRGP